MALAFSRFELDEERFELRLDGAPARIEPRVLDVILYLARHRDRIVSKDELIDNVWRQSVSESALTRAITAARKILESGDAADAIRTIHGRGYRFVAPVAAAPPPGAPSPAAPSAVLSTPAAAGGGRTRAARIALATALVAAAVSGSLWVRARAAAPGGTLARVALLPISTDADDREAQLLAFSVSDSLANVLSRA